MLPHTWGKTHPRNFFNQFLRNSYLQKFRPAKYKRYTLSKCYITVSLIFPTTETLDMEDKSADLPPHKTTPEKKDLITGKNSFPSNVCKPHSPSILSLRLPSFLEPYKLFCYPINKAIKFFCLPQNISSRPLSLCLLLVSELYLPPR